MFPKKELIEEVAEIKGISATFIEKDWFVTQVIQVISAISYEDFSIVFTGGTALSKAYNLINRFSEDIDFRVLTPSLVNLSNSQQSKILSNFKNYVIAELRTHFNIENSQITARNGNRFFSVELDYPTFFGRADSLRPHVLLEITVADLNLPSLLRPVSSMINQVANKPGEIPQIACIDPVESAADKLSAITWRIAERIRGTESDSPDIVRHLHDLALLKELALKHPNFPLLVQQSLERDNNRSELLKGLSASEKFAQLLQIIDSDLVYPKEYNRFVNAMSYAEPSKTPTFQNSVQSIHSLIDNVILNLK